MTDMGASFHNAKKFTGRGSISEWSVPKVTTFRTKPHRRTFFFNPAFNNIHLRNSRTTESQELVDTFHGDTLLSDCT